jgi:tetratricopeptide (TPR) repeat protein
MNWQIMPVVTRDESSAPPGARDADEPVEDGRRPRVFISYSHDSEEHRSQVLELADRLRSEGVDAWIDRYVPSPRRGWQQWIIEQIAKADFILCICTATYKRRFEGEETPGTGRGVTFEGLVATQLIYEIDKHKKELIPVLLSGESEDRIPMALRPFSRYRLPAEHDALYRQVTGQPYAPAPPLGPLKHLEPRSGGVAIDCPYPGMVPFEDARFFYGRKSDTERLVQHIRDHKLTLLVGPSGSGKSSLLRAGVELALANWPVCRVRLAARPCAALREALGMGEGDPAVALTAALDTLLAGHENARVLVVVDPLEELFLAAADEQASFCELARLLVAEPRCAPVLALRADFYAELMASELWDLAEHSVVHVRPPGGDALRAAIRKPAEAQGVVVEDALVEHLMADAAGEPGMLPLLQETLRWLWEERERRELGLVLPGSLYDEAERAGHDERVTPLAATLARKADVALADLAKADRVVARRVMVRLVQFGEGRPHTRRQQKLEDLAESESLQAVQRVVQHLAERRMLALSGEQGEGVRRVDLAHEALIHAWPTFKEWIKEWREHEQKRRRFEVRAEEWVMHGRRGGLLDAVALAEAEEWLASDAAAQVGASEDVRGLVAASRHVLRRARLWRRIAVSVLVVLLGAATVFGVLATRARTEAERQRAETERQRDRARNAILVSRDLASQIVWAADRKLKQVAGAAEVRRELLDVAGQLLERLSNEDASDLDAKRDLAVRHDQRGDLALSHDDLGQARQHYQASLELAQELVATDPDNAEWQRDLFVSHIKLGAIEEAAGNLDQARARYKEGLEIMRKLAEADPGNARWQRDLSVSHNRLGDIERAAGNLDQARARYSQSLEIMRKLAEADPGNAEWQPHLSVSHNKLGEIEEAAGNLDQARARYSRTLEILTKLAEANPGNAEWQRDLSVSHIKLGDIEVAAGNLDQARARYKEGMEIARKLAKADPGNAEWQRDLSVSYDRLGHIEVAAGNLDQARALHTKRMEIARKLAEADPGNAGWQRDLVASEMRLALVNRDQGKLADARRHLDAAKAVLARINAAGMLRGDALLEQYRQDIADLERELRP